MPHSASRVAGALLAALAVLGTSTARAQGPAPVLAPAQLSYGQSTSVSGVSAAGAPIVLQVSAYPYRTGFTAIAQVAAGVDGSWGFPGLRPDRNTRYRILVAGTPSAVAQAIVSAAATQTISRLRDGRVRITLATRHPADLRWGRATVRWFAAPAGSRHFALLAQSRTREPQPGLTLTQASFFAPVGKFNFRACFNPPGEAAMGPLSAHLRCPQRDFSIGHAVNH